LPDGFAGEDILLQKMTSEDVTPLSSQAGEDDLESFKEDSNFSSFPWPAKIYLDRNFDT